jgi:hypothetical protein
MINTFIQILLSIFLIAIMAFISYTVYNKEYINSIDLSSSNRKITKIFAGILDYSKESNLEFETFNKTDYTYIDINPSINQNGGAEYSYNFWLYFDVDSSSNLIVPETTPTNYIPLDGGSNNEKGLVNDYTDKLKYKYIILFYKGENKRLPLNKINKYHYSCNHKTFDYDDQIIIKNPLIKIRNDGKQIIVDYNNINSPESYNSDFENLLCSDTDFLEKRNNNKIGIKNISVDNYKRKFNMITVVFKEHSETEQLFYKKNASCKIYLNKKLITDRLATIENIENDQLAKFNSRVMKSNFSKLHINPIDNSGIKSIPNHTLGDTITETPAIQVADLTYFNYALTQKEIDRLYDIGFNKYPASFKKIIAKNFNKGDYTKDTANQL